MNQCTNVSSSDHLIGYILQYTVHITLIHVCIDRDPHINPNVCLYMWHTYTM